MANEAPFIINPLYSGISIAYKNEEFIADIVSPRISIPTITFNYRIFTLGENMQVIDDLVGRTSSPKRVEFTETETEATAIDHGLEDVVPQKDIEIAAKLENYDPMAIASEGITDLVLLAREKRAADLLFNSNSYASTNRTILTGTDQWNDPASNPIKAVEAGKDAVMHTPTHLLLGSDTYRILRSHPAIVNAVRKMYAIDGIVKLADLSELFELQVVIGKARYNTAKPGQTPAFAKLWGKHASILSLGPGAGPRGRIVFGFTAQWGTRIALTRFDSAIGLRGANVLKVGETVKELVIAPTLGYLFTNAVA